LVELAHGVADAVASGETDPESAAQGMLGELVGLAVGQDAGGFVRVDASEYLALLEAIEGRAETARQLARGDAGAGVAFGFTAVDRHVLNLLPGELVTIGAGPKVGKTATVLKIATHNVIDRQQHVGAISAEMTRTEYLERCANHLARVRVHDTARGHLSDVERARLMKEGSRLTSGPGGLHVHDVDFPELGRVLAAIQSLKVEQPGLSLVTVDYLQLVTKRMDGRRGDEEIAAVCAGLKAIAKRCDLTVIAPAQLNYKETDTRSDGKPTLRDYQGASAPAQTANFPMLLWRPHLHSPMADPRELWLLAPRSRRCAPFEAKLLWEGEYLSVGNWPAEWESARESA
jgi:replicative DNA helicase